MFLFVLNIALSIVIEWDDIKEIIEEIKQKIKGSKSEEEKGLLNISDTENFEK